MRELLCSKNCSGAENTPQNEMQDVRGGLLKLRIPLWVVWPAGAHLPWAPLQDEGSSLPVYRSLWGPFSGYGSIMEYRRQAKTPRGNPLWQTRSRGQRARCPDPSGSISVLCHQAGWLTHPSLTSVSLHTCRYFPRITSKINYFIQKRCGPSYSASSFRKKSDNTALVLHVWVVLTSSGSPLSHFLLQEPCL